MQLVVSGQAGSWIDDPAFGQTLEFDVLELHEHRSADVDLQGEDAFESTSLFIVIDEVDRLFAVNELLEMVPFGDDVVFVPLGDVELVEDLVAKRTDDLLFALFVDDDLLSDLGEDAPAAFFVEDARKSADGHVGLIALDDERVGLVLGEMDGSVLDARVTPFHAELALEFKVGDGAVLPDQEGVRLDPAYPW